MKMDVIVDRKNALYPDRNHIQGETDARDSLTS